MPISIDREQLLKLAKYFHTITKTVICIYDADCNAICAYPNTSCHFCTEVRKCDVLLKKCLEDDENAFAMCKKTGKTYIYRCHMGLVEVATPIICNNRILGYMLFGQITNNRDKSGIYSLAEQLDEALNVNRKALLASCDGIRYRSDEYIESISALLEMCASYIWLNSLMTVRNDSLAYALELYIKEHLSQDLSYPVLCKQFNFSRSKLYEISRSNFGYGLSRYISLCRLEKAKQLLCDLEHSVTSVAEAVGFEDVNYFIRFFKKETGLTPKRYQTRKKIQKKP